MPATRKSTGSTASSRSKSRPATQTKLAFSNKVTKSQALKSSKDKKPLAKPLKAIPISIDLEPELSESESTEPSIASISLPAVSIDPIDAKARQIKESQIKKLFTESEKGRVAPRVHQSDITISEKLLRSWDVDSKYGPCIGIDRTRRWRRAHKFGLNPPIEILAILLREEDQNGGKEQRAHLDEIMASKFAE